MAGAGLADRLRDQVAATYGADLAVANYTAQAAEAVLKPWEVAVVEQTMGQGVRKVLAVGCGAGREVFALEALGYDAAGADITPALIDAAHAEAARRGSSARLVLSDGARLPFADGEFDAVVMWAQVLGLVPYAAGRAAFFLAEARRVLRSRGAMSLSCHDDALTRPLLTEDRIVSRDVPEPGDLVVHEPAFGGDNYFRYFTEAEVRGLCEGAGFTVETVAHTDDLGQAWGNVFVVMARAV